MYAGKLVFAQIYSHAGAPESAFLVQRISFKCFEFHVSGFKLFESDW